MRLARRIISYLLFVGLLASIVSQVAAQSTTQRETGSVFAYDSPSPETYRRLAEEVDTTFREDVLAPWFPRAIDEQNGGFHSNFSREWGLSRSEGKFSVFQGRMTWITAQIAMRRPDLRGHYISYAQHGIDYLTNVMWDKQYGGFYWGLNDVGQASLDYSNGKHLYGMSFCVYGLAAGYQATEDPKALELAQEAFRWMDAHAHDTKNGGYFEWLTRDGKVYQNKPGAVTFEEVKPAGFPIGYKSMNTHIHLLEAYTELYKVWKDDTLRQRLEELLAITRDKIAMEPGVMNLYFTNDWRALPGHDSYGHDVETAYLMLEAAEVLGRPHDSETERMAKMLVDHALLYGWDDKYGGIYREGTAFGGPEDMKKEWWEQVENLNALLLMHEKYGQQNDTYFRAFQQQWAFIKQHQVDPKYGGLYSTVQRDGSPTDYNKARIWKAAYHDGRAFLNVHERLLRLAGAK